MDEYRSKYEAIEDILDEIIKLLEDLYQSGFDTVHDSTLKDLEKTGELTEQYGMQYLSGLLGGLADEISAGRHRTEEMRATDKKALVAELYTRLNEYLYLGRQKAVYDRGKHYYTEVEFPEVHDMDEDEMNEDEMNEDEMNQGEMNQGKMNEDN